MFKNVRTLLFGGLAGKVLGVARELIAAALLGTGFVATAFRLSQAAFFIPVQGFLSDALTSGFTPVYARNRIIRSEEADLIFSGMHSILVAISLVVGTCLAVFARRWVDLLAPGFDESTATLAAHMVECLAAAMPLYSLTALYAATELAAGRAGMSAVRASVQSAGLIVGIVLSWILGDPLLIPVGFLLAHVCLAVWGARTAVRSGLRLWPRLNKLGASISVLAPIWSAYKYLICVPALMQAHFVVERRIASIDNSHAVAALDYARFISETVVLLIAMPFGLAGLASMAGTSVEKFRQMSLQSMRILLYLGVPISVFLMCHADWVVRIAFGRGAFGRESVATTTSILTTLAVGLWAQLVGYAGARFLSARNLNRELVLFYVVAVSTNIALNYILQKRLGVAGLGLASAVSSLIIGVAVLARLKLLRSLRLDFLALFLVSVGYWLMSLVSPRMLIDSRWMPAILFTVYWVGIFLVLPRFREVVGESWRLLRREQ